MVGKNFGQLLRITSLSLEQRSKSIVERRPLRLGERRIGRIADEEMAETQLVAIPVSCYHQALAAERLQSGFWVGASHQLPNLGRFEPLADDTGRLQDTLFVVRQAVQPGRQHGLDAVGDLDLVDLYHRSPARPVSNQSTVVDQHLDEFLAEERRARRTLDDLRAQVRRQRLDLEQSG